MKMEEAAAILGIPVNADLEILKNTYRKMALAWHPDKCTDPHAKDKFQQISVAYTKLMASRTGGSDDDADSDEDGAQSYSDDIHEMRAFMRMFMDLVGIFNEDEHLMEEGKLPGGVSFGMMFGHPSDHNCDDWSTEDECDEDDYDSDGNEEENGTLWEPMVKHYFHMNLKEEINKSKQWLANSMSQKESDEMEAKRKQRNAKKRSEKRRKQKEKRVREAAEKAEEDERLRRLEEAKAQEQEEAMQRRKEELRLQQEAEMQRRMALFQSVAEGNVSEVQDVITTTSSRITERYQNKTGCSLLHYCISDFGYCFGPEAQLLHKEVKCTQQIAAQRLQIAQFLLSCKSPSLDLSCLDDQGRTVMHIAALCGDIKILNLMLEHREQGDKKTQIIDINARCVNLGWTPLHYAAGNGVTVTTKALIDAGAILNVHAHSTTVPGKKDAVVTSGEKGPTPLQLVKLRLQENYSGNITRNLQNVESMLTEAVQRLENLKAQREAERANKDAKLRAEKQKQAAKEQAEKELLEKKQRQLREKQEKKEEEERLKQLQQQSSTASEDKKKKKKKKKKDESQTQSTVSAPPQPVPEPAPVSTASVLETAEAEIRSRDELLDHLLAMGFAENDCYAAITACGVNVERAISWLCDRPAMMNSKTTTAVANKREMEDKAREEHAKEQKEKDLKEELRRINRAWNAKVPQQRAEEEEKKKKAMEAEKAQKELEKRQLLMQQAPYFPPAGAASPGSYPVRAPHTVSPQSGVVHGSIEPSPYYAPPVASGEYPVPQPPPGMARQPQQPFETYPRPPMRTRGPSLTDRPPAPAAPDFAGPPPGYGGFQSSLLSNDFAYNGGNVFEPQFEQQTVSGAVELSAGAKPFVPKFSTSSILSSPSLTPAGPPASAPSLADPLAPPSQMEWSMLGGDPLYAGLPPSLGAPGLGAPGLSGVSGLSNAPGWSGLDYDDSKDIDLNVPLNMLGLDDMDDDPLLNALNDPVSDGMDLNTSSDDLGQSLLGRLGVMGGSNQRRGRLYEGGSSFGQEHDMFQVDGSFHNTFGTDKFGEQFNK